MNYKELSELLQESVDFGDKKGFAETVKQFIKTASEEDAAEYLASFVHTYFTTYKADAAAGLMQIILQEKQSLGFVYFPDNTFFRSAILHGSLDLFNCYNEEFVQPYLKKKPKVNADEFYADLMSVVDSYTEVEDKKAKQLVKGMHFNGAFGKAEENPNLMFINKEDYDIMDATIEKYNAIIGRRLIMKKLENIYSKI